MKIPKILFVMVVNTYFCMKNFGNIFFIMFLFLTVNARSEISIKTVDFLKEVGVSVNAAGPLFVQADPDRNRIVVANTLSSSVSIIDGETHGVVNIPIEGRALQHLKSEALTLNKQTGDVCLVGAKAFHIVYPEKESATSIPTEVQFESIAVDESTGNIFLAGRESKSMGFYEAGSQELKLRKWLDHEEKLINLNQTPPPPIRKVIADNVLQNVIAVDGYTSTFYLFDSNNGKVLKSRPIPLTTG